HVRKLRRSGGEKGALASVRLEQDDFTSGQRSRDRNARRATAGADVDDRPVEALDEGDDGEAFLEVDARRLGRVADRGQARRLEQPLEPALESGVNRARRRRTGTAP